MEKTERNPLGAGRKPIEGEYRKLKVSKAEYAEIKKLLKSIRNKE